MSKQSKKINSQEETPKEQEVIKEEEQIKTLYKREGINSLAKILHKEEREVNGHKAIYLELDNGTTCYVEPSEYDRVVVEK